MSISFDGALESMNLDVQDLIGLSDTQIEEKISENLPDLSASELTTFMDELRERISEIENDLLELQEGYEEDIDAAEDDDNTEAASRYETRLEEVQEALDTLDNIEEAAQDVIEHQEFLNIETDQDINWSYDTTELNAIASGDTVSIKALAGTQAGSFGETEEEETAAVDTNGDGFITYDEMYATDTSEAFAGQDLFLQINSGDKIIAASEAGGVLSLTIATADGKTFTMNIEGSPNIYFSGSDYVDTSLLSALSDDTLKRMFENSDTTSFYGHMNESDASDEERLAVIDGYTDIIDSNTLAALWTDPYLSANAHNTENGTITSYGAAQPAYEYAINALFGYIDDTSTTKGTIDTVWGDIFQEWTSLGLNTFDFSTLISNVVMGVAMKGNQALFQSFFAPVITTLEGYFETSATDDGNKKSTLEKMVITLLETQSGATGNYGGTSVWTTAYAHTSGDDVVDGTFTDNDENVEVIGMYQSFIATTGWAVLSGSESTALANEEKMVEHNKEVQDASVDDAMSSVETLLNFNWDTFLDFRSSYIDVYDQGSNGISEDDLKGCLAALIEKIRGLENPTVENVQNAIYDYVSTLEDDAWKDDVAALFLVMLHDKANDLFNQISTTDFKNKMWKIIDNGGDVPPAVNGVNDEYKGLADYWDMSYDKQDVGEAIGDAVAAVGEFFTDIF